MLIIGGRTNNVGENLTLDVYDTETSEWTKFNSMQRFRHGSCMVDIWLYIFGGFELEQPNVPTSVICRVNLQKLFSNHETLLNKFQNLSKSSSGSTSPTNLS